MFYSIFLPKKFAKSKIVRTFALVKRKNEKVFIDTTYWRDGRVVDCGGLENR